jgi:hypothetical protein
MKNQNGILVYQKDDVIRFPEELKRVMGAESKFGFKGVVKEGKMSWEKATEDDFRSAESIRLGIPKREVRLSDCPTDISVCTGPVCGGGQCYVATDIYVPYFYCACS